MIAIIRTWVHFFWFLFKWGVVPGTIVAIIALPYIYRRIDVEIRDTIRDQFAAHYPDFDVEVRSAVRVEGCGIEVRDFTIRDPRLKGPDAVLVDIEQISLCCSTDLANLVAGRITVDRVTIQRPTFRVTRAADGSWSFERLWPLPKCSEGSPDIEIKNGTVELIDASKPTPSRWTLRDVNLSIITQRDELSGQLVRKIDGHLMGEYLDQVKFKGQMSMDSSEWKVAGSVAQVDITPELHQALPGISARDTKLYSSFRGKAAATFRLQSDSSQPNGVHFEVAGDIKQGRFDDARLPGSITDVHAEFCATPKGFSISNLKGRFGRSVLSLTCYRAGYDAYSLWDVDATVENLQLEPRLVAGLPENFRRVWRKFSPSGQIDIKKLKLLTDGRSFHPEHFEATIHCRDLASTYDKFPYQVEEGVGKIEIKNNVLKVKGMRFKGGDDQPIFVDCEWVAPFKPKPCGYVRVRGFKIPFDKRVYDAIDATNEKGSKIIRNLKLGGIADFDGVFERKSPQSKPIKYYTITLHDASICFKYFPYPLKHLRGRVERRPDESWAFSNLQAVNGPSVITGSGWLAKQQNGDQRLHFDIQGDNVTIGDDLHKAIAKKQSMGQAWKNVQPSGSVDVKTMLDWTVNDKKLHMKVIATPRGDTVSIEPVSFPYRLEAIHGPMVFENGQVFFGRFRGKHGSTTVLGSGSCEFLSDGNWELRLKNMEVANLQLNRELIQACPPRLRKGLTNLNPKGSMYIANGDFILNHSLDPNIPLTTKWDFKLGFQQSSLECGGLHLENINGTMDLGGGFDGKKHVSTGELAIDSVTYKGFHFTEVKGPIYINDDLTWFGSPDYGRKRPSGNPKRPTTKKGPINARPLTYKFYGGRVISTGWVHTGGPIPRYAFGAYLTQADLARFTKETNPGTQEVTGQFSGKIQISGAGQTLSGLEGFGELKLRNADIYELPFMVRLLKILTVPVRDPDKTAFSRADINFKIENSKIDLKKVEFNGDAISLLGEGKMDFDSTINLDLYPVVGRNDIHVPFISPIFSGASQQTLRVRVNGPISNPEIQREAFPYMKEAILRLDGLTPQTR